MRKYCVILSLLFSALLYANGVKIADLYYLLDDENQTAIVTYTIDTIPTKEKPSTYYGSIVIPESVTYNDLDYTVTEIGEKAFYYSSVVAVEIPSTISKIGAQAFAWSYQLLRMDIPGNVKEIGANAFDRCDWLAEVHLEEGVEIIGGSAFQNCYKLASLNFPTTLKQIGGSNGVGTLISSVILNSKETLRINSYAFSQAYQLKTLVINCPVVLESHTFEYCYRLDSVELGTKITKIAGCMFRGCSGLRHINLPENITSIEGYGFDGCSSLKSVNMSSAITNIGAYAFQDCSSLTELHLPDALQTIGTKGFKGATHLKELDMSHTKVTDIPASAFADCSSLERLLFSDSTTTIAPLTGVTALKEIRLPAEKYKVVAANTFADAPLTSLILPGTIDSISTHAFLGDSLSVVYCRALTPPGLDTVAFAFTGSEKTKIDSLCVPEESISLYLNSGWTQYFEHICGIMYGVSEVDEITDHSAQIKWVPDSTGIVSQYAIDVYQAQNHIAHYDVDAEGNLMAPPVFYMRKDTTYASEDYYVLTISDLSSGTDYDYTIVGMDDQKVPVYIEEGSFRTESTEGFFDAIITETDKPRKIIRNGQIYILKGEVIYTLQGQKTNP